MRRAVFRYVSVLVFGSLSLSVLTAIPAGRILADEGVETVKKSNQTWAHVVVKGGYPEGAQTPGLFGDITEGLADGIARIAQAANDDKISGVVLHIQSPKIGWAKLNEFRKAIGRIQAQDKKVYAWLDDGSSMSYLLASACDEIIMPEPAALMLLGLRAEVSFYKNLFDLLDIKPEMLRVGEYKSAAEPYTRTEMSPEFRQEMEAILDDYYRQMIEMVAEGRGLDKDKVTSAIDSGPHTAKAALELGLIDRLAYEDELETAIKGDDKVDLQFSRDYGKKKVNTDFSGLQGLFNLMELLTGNQKPKRSSSDPKIAVIHASGMIMTGRSKSDMLTGANVLGSETLIKAIRKANEDKTVKAVVLRVDSPGGSALASDLIWRALKQLDKPLVVSMGDTAASGGYYISMGADYIFAEPGTLTGSIGVVGGKLALDGLFKKAGITTSIISRGKNSGVMSGTQGFSDSEREAMSKLLHDIYEQFTKKAAQGRKMKYDDLEKLARGRVYTGAMAVDNGLVDKLGTLDDAVDYAKQLAGMKADDKIERLILPKPASPFEQLFGPLDAGVGVKGASVQSLSDTVRALSPELAEHLQSASLINLLSHEPRLTVLPFRLSVK
jgi:protease IV